jgi:hypothetical protein
MSYNLCISNFVFVWAMSYCTCDTFITIHFMPYLSWSDRSDIVLVVNLSHDIMWLSFFTSYVCFMSFRSGSLIFSWSEWCHIVHVLHLPHDIMCLSCPTCYVPFMSLSLRMSSFLFVCVMSSCTCDKFTTWHFMPLLYNLLCPFLVVRLSMSYFLLFLLMFYCTSDKFTTWHSLPLLSNLLCPFSCRYSSDPLPPIRLSDVILSMSNIYHMILFANPV